MDGRQPTLPMSLEPPVPQPLQEQAFEALLGLGAVPRDTAVRTVANQLMRLGLIPSFKKLRQKSALYRHVDNVIRASVRAGRLERPSDEEVRAVLPRARDYTTEHWRLAVLGVLTGELGLREQIIRDAADWARENMGLQFKRLSSRSAIYRGIDQAIERGIEEQTIKQVADDYIRLRPSPKPNDAGE